MTASTDRSLPQLGGELFLTDGGLETTLIFHRGVDLPDFAAFPLLRTEPGRAELARYFNSYLELARASKRGFILESPTWRASADWAQRLGFSQSELAALNRAAIEFLRELRDREGVHEPRVVSGCVGPRGDGYVAKSLMSAGEARAYHRPQIEVFADAGADMISAITMNYVEEAVGVALSARDAGVPAAISFTVETDGRLPTGDALGEAVERVDTETGGSVAYYMINCAHPSHFAHVIDAAAPWVSRVRGLRVNASKKSHAELNEATELDDGDPVALGADCRALRGRLPEVTVLGGCCGTDERHVAAIHAAWAR